MFSCLVEYPCFHVGVELFGCNSSMKTTSGQTSPDSRCVYLGTTGFCQFWADDTAWHLPISKGNKLDVFFISCIKFPWPTTASTILNVARFFVLLQKSLNSTSGNPGLLWNLCLGETLLMQYNYIVSCCCAQSCHVWPLTWNCLPQPHLGSRVWLFLTQF